MSLDRIDWFCAWNVQKWDEDAVTWLTAKLGRTPQGVDFEAMGIVPYADEDVPGNLLTTAGLGRVTSLIVAGGGQGYDNTHARIGVGNGVGTAAVGDTDLSASAGSTNRWFQLMDAGKPTTSGGVMTFAATFASADGNFAWNEFSVDNGTASSNAVTAVLLNHKTSIAQGTKTAGQSWTATATVTLS